MSDKDVAALRRLADDERVMARYHREHAARSIQDAEIAEEKAKVYDRAAASLECERP